MLPSAMLATMNDMKEIRDPAAPLDNLVTGMMKQNELIFKKDK